VTDPVNDGSTPLLERVRSAPGERVFRLDGRVAFVSGAAGHLGRAMAAALAEAGAHVVLNGRRQEALALAGAEIGKLRIFEYEQAWVRVPDETGDWHEQVKLCLAIRHFYERAFLRGFAHEVRFWVQRLQVRADGSRFRQQASVVQFEHRHT